MQIELKCAEKNKIKDTKYIVAGTNWRPMSTTSSVPLDETPGMVSTKQQQDLLQEKEHKMLSKVVVIEIYYYTKYNDSNNWNEQQEVMDKYEPFIQGYWRKFELYKSLISSAITTENNQCTSEVPTVSKDTDTKFPGQETVKQSKQLKRMEILD